MKRVNFLVLSFCFCFSLLGQERGALTFGNFNGINATHLNPAFSTKSANPWDLQIGGAHVHVDTNLGKITNSNLFRVINQFDQIYIPNLNDDLPTGNESMRVIFSDKEQIRALAKIDILGPGFLTNFKKDFKIGFSTRARIAAGVRRLPTVLELDKSFEIPIRNEYYTVNKFNTANAVWVEYALHFAHSVNEQFAYGVNVKFLNGKAGAWFSNDNNFFYSHADEDTFDLLQATNFSYAHSVIIRENIKWATSNPGVALDLGVVINDLFKEGSSLGISIIDLGLMRMSGPESVGTTNNSTIFDWELYGTLKPEEILDQLIVDGIVQKRDDKFTLYTPTAFSIQYSHPLDQHFAMNMSLVQSLKFAKTHLPRPNGLNFNLSYEREFFSAYLPISMQEYVVPKIGLAFRLAYLTIGSDDLTSLIGKSNFNSTDLYINFNFFPFEWERKKKDKKSKKGKTEGKILCPKF